MRPCLPPFPLNPRDIFSSISILANARVSLKLKTKIWEKQYIHFGSLVVTPVQNGRYQLTLQHLDEGSAPSLTLEPLAKQKKISTFDSWLQAFHVFVAVYSSKNPQAAPGLMKYGSIIQDLATKGHNWRYYDENVRLRQSPSTALPWGNVHRLAGPFSSPPFSVFRVSPLGLVPKKSLGKFCLTHHLSFSKGSSLNDGISPENTRVSYATVEDAIRFIKSVGSGCFLAKTDLKNAFRIIPFNPQDYHLSGIRWNGLYYYDRAMPMGFSSSCKTFETFSTAIEWIVQQKLNVKYILHLLDDFLIVAPTKELCHHQLNLFLMLCSYLGIPMAPEKTIGPASTITFAGIELDSVLMEARLPHEKLIKCCMLISEFLTCKKVTQSNGRSFFLSDAWCTSTQLELYTDAYGSLGFGAIFSLQWCYGKWPASWQHRNIVFLEFYPIVLSL